MTERGMSHSGFLGCWGAVVPMLPLYIGKKICLAIRKTTFEETAPMDTMGTNSLSIRNIERYSSKNNGYHEPFFEFGLQMDSTGGRLI